MKKIKWNDNVPKQNGCYYTTLDDGSSDISYYHKLRGWHDNNDKIRSVIKWALISKEDLPSPFNIKEFISVELITIIDELGELKSEHTYIDDRLNRGIVSLLNKLNKIVKNIKEI